MYGIVKDQGPGGHSRSGRVLSKRLREPETQGLYLVCVRSPATPGAGLSHPVVHRGRGTGPNALKRRTNHVVGRGRSTARAESILTRIMAV